ncbi:polysaccharide deacetylase [Labilithrix luteola]|uniref:Polysaccharide deacetylase n=1 Tax=Labilithrix luteola TaxID=1391654 RepID=A0A0K1PRD5_9BACT|nr:polysaccharide deacetylase [Labilithrix luteola]
MLLPVVTAVVLAACQTEHRGLDEATTGNVRQALSQTQFTGTSLPAKTLALTFDDGPGTRTAELSGWLHTQGIQAAFFVNGARVNTTPLPNPNGITPTPNPTQILQQLVDDGHLVANHTTTHRNIRTEVPSNQLAPELAETDNAIAGFAPVNRLLFRAPYGDWSTLAANTLAASAMNKYVGPIYWDMGGNSTAYPGNAADWACWQGQLTDTNGELVNGNGYATTTQCGDAYLNEIRAVGRGIVLMHDPYGWDQGDTVEMVKYIVPILQKEGYAFVRVDQVPAIAAALPCDANCLTCTGPNACTSCVAGSYLAGGTCHPCSTCANGTFQASACVANADTVCQACDATCTTCKGGTSNDCSTCQADRYLEGNRCLPCTACAAGTYQTATCTPSANTVCEACDASCATCAGAGTSACTTCAGGAYLSNGKCLACNSCAAGTYASTACTATTDTVCSPCAASCATCHGPGANDCGSCAPKEFLSNGSCESCSTCAAGTSTATACGTTEDTKCVACTNGTWAPANAQTCEPCGNCDDGNACTTDRCDPTRGCVHEQTDCNVAADAGSPEPSAPPDGAVGAEDDAGAPSTVTPLPPPVSPPSGSGCTTGRARDGSRPGLGLLALFGVALMRRSRGAGRGRNQDS